MSTANIELYNALVAAGVDKDKAEKVAAEVLTKTEAKETLATKSDLEVALHTQSSTLIKWFTGVMIAQTAVLIGLMQLFFGG